MELLYDKYWKKFDDDFWREEVKQGRLKRPCSDLFIQHFLASKQTEDIPIKQLFAEYKSWIERERPYPSVEAELTGLSRQGDDFRRIVEPKKGDVLYELVTFLDAFDIRTAYPLLLHLLEQNLSKSDWEKISVALESHLLRRAVCGLTTKNYNRTFLSLTKTLRKDGTSPDRIIQALSDSKGESNEWPRDEQFRVAWNDGGTYQLLQSKRLQHLLLRLDDTFFGDKNEALSVNSELSIEHLMPQKWMDNWPLPDGSKGLTYEELEDADPASPGVIATKRFAFFVGASKCWRSGRNLRRELAVTRLTARRPGHRPEQSSHNGREPNYRQSLFQIRDLLSRREGSIPTAVKVVQRAQRRPRRNWWRRSVAGWRTYQDGVQAGEYGVYRGS